MCGIAGYIGKNPPDQSILKKTSSILSHRGPDGEGFYNHSIKNNHCNGTPSFSYFRFE